MDILMFIIPIVKGLAVGYFLAFTLELEEDPIGAMAGFLALIL